MGVLFEKGWCYPMMDYGEIVKTPEEKELLRNRELAWLKYIDARNRLDEEYDETRYLRRMYEKSQSRAKKELTKKTEVIRQSKKIWEDYNAFLDYHCAKIRELRKSACVEYSKMKECYSKADAAMERGDAVRASAQQKKGRNHESNYEKIKTSIHDLTMEIQYERIRVDAVTPKYDNSMLEVADADAAVAKEKYEETRKNCERLRLECEDLRMEYYRALDIYESYIASMGT